MRDELSDKMEHAETRARSLDRQMSITGRQMRTMASAAAIVGGSLLGMAYLAIRTADTQGILAAKTKDLQASTSELAKTVGTTLIPIVKTALEFFNGLVVLLNKVPAPLLQSIGVLMLFGGTLLTVGGSVLMFMTTIQRLAMAYRTLAATQAVAQVLALGPGGIALAAAALAAGAAVGIGINRIVNAQQGAIINRPMLARVGETESEAIIPLSRMPQMGGGTYNINIVGGTFLGNDQEARAWANKLHPYIRERERLGL